VERLIPALDAGGGGNYRLAHHLIAVGASLTSNISMRLPTLHQGLAGARMSFCNALAGGS